MSLIWRCLTDERLEEVWVDASILSGLDAADAFSGCWSVAVFIGLVVGPVGFTI